MSKPGLSSAERAPAARNWNPLRWFAAGTDAPRITDPERVNQLYRRNRLSVMFAITCGYGFGYTCRLPLAVMKKPLLDEGVFTAEWLGLDRLGLLHRLRGGQAGERLPGRPRQRAPVLRRHGADVGADQPGHARLCLPVGLGDSVGAERVVPGRRVALQRGLAGQLVQRPGTRHATTASSAARIRWARG